MQAFTVQQPGLYRWTRPMELQSARAARAAPRSLLSDRGAVSRIHSSTTARAQADANTETVDPFVDATLRLQRLVANVGDGEEEMLNSILYQEPADKKLQIYALFGGLITTTAFGVCWLCGTDPWGGASLSLHSLQSAAVGALMVAPFAALRAWSWKPEAADVLTSLPDMHDMQAESSAPWLSGLNTQHLLMLMSLEILPLLFLLLPAAQGGISASIGLYNELMKSVVGLTIPEDIGMGGALLVTALLAGGAKSLEIGVETEEYEVVRTAVENADRYYKLMAMQMNTSADHASTAFKAVALTWITSKEDASLMAGIQGFVDTIMLGMIWRLTGDLSSAGVAAMLLYSVDYHHLHARVNKGSRGSSDGSRSGDSSRGGQTGGPQGESSNS